MKKIKKSKSRKFPVEVARFFHPEKSLSAKSVERQMQIMSTLRNR